MVVVADVIILEVAEARVGASHLATPAIRVAVASPFDYAAQTRVIVVNDVNARDIGQLAAAYKALFQASGGGGLGLGGGGGGGGGELGGGGGGLGSAAATGAGGVNAGGVKAGGLAASAASSSETLASATASVC